MMARMLSVCSLLLLCVTVVCAKDPAGELDEVFADEVQKTQRVFLGVEQQLSAALQVADLFVLEDAQLKMFALETRAKLQAIQEETRWEMESAMQEVEVMQQAAVENATTWRKTLQGLRDVTQRNRQTLQRIREEKEEGEKKKLMKELELQEKQEIKAKRELELLQELERQQQAEKELEEVLKRLQELERLQEIEKQRELEQLQELEKEHELQQELEKVRELKKQEMEKQHEQNVMPDASSSDSTKRNNGVEEDTQPSEGAERMGAVKWLLAWYVSAERTVFDATATIYRQLMLPVVAILGFFLVLTVAIARYNAMVQARRNRRVLYSGYPKSYRPKAKQEMKPVLTDGASPD